MLYLRLVNATLRLWIKPLWTRSPTADRVRRRFRRLDQIGSLGRRAVPVSRESVGGVDVEWIRPTHTAGAGVVVFLHGGAFCGRAERADRRFCQRISALTGLPVLLLPYRLAPEHPFPAALEDGVRVLAALSGQGVVVVGHSAGANLALSALMRMRDAGQTLPAGAVLLSAPLDLTPAGAAATADHRHDSMASHALLPWVVRHYVAGADVAHPDISPLLGDWQGLPSLSFHASTSEMLVPDSRRAVDMAQRAAVDAELHLWERQPHNFAFVDGLPEAAQCHRQVSQFIQRALAAQARDGRPG